MSPRVFLVPESARASCERVMDVSTTVHLRGYAEQDEQMQIKKPEGEGEMRFQMSGKLSGPCHLVMGYIR